MEDDYGNLFVFDDSSEIDFDYEFDVAKFYDFTRPETLDEITESELWFEGAKGYPPSPLVFKLHWGAEELGGSETSSCKSGHLKTHSVYNGSSRGGASAVSSLCRGKTGQQSPNSKSKCPSQTSLPRSSRLLKPTASHLAKQNQQGSVGSRRSLGRLHKLRSPLKSPGEIVATKRQKLESGYLRKVAHLKHQVSFSHKSTKRIGNTDAKSHARPKVTIPREPDLQTAHRAQRQRSKNAAQPGNNRKSDSCSTSASLQERAEPVYKFKARPFNKKIFSSKGDIGVPTNSKRETTVPKEFKLSSSKKLSHNPPIELFNKLSLNSENQPSLSPEEKKPLGMKKGFKKNVPSSNMKENKVPNALTEKSIKCCLNQSQFGRERTITDIGNILTSARLASLLCIHARMLETFLQPCCLSTNKG